MEVLEEWRDVVGYEGLYEVSNLGRVRNSRGLIRKQTKDRGGYMNLALTRDGTKKYNKVHRLVWEAFNGTIPEGMQIDHVNTIRDDNRLVNLRCVTPRGNQFNPLTRKRYLEGIAARETNKDYIIKRHEVIRKVFAKPVLQLDKDTGEVIREWPCAADAWRELGINAGNISSCCYGRQKTAGGYRWRLVLESCS